MTYLAPNSVQARDIASIVHPQTNLVRHLEDGPFVVGGGDGCFITDDNGKRYLDAAAGLWCASLGYASERLARVAYEQMRKSAITIFTAAPRRRTRSIWRRNYCPSPRCR